MAEVADHERLLLAKVIRERAMAELVDAKIGEQFFLDEEHLRVLRWMTEHWQKHGTSPSEQALRADFPNYELPETPEPLSWYLAKTREAYEYDVLGTAVQDAADDLSADQLNIDQIKTRLTNALTTVNTVSSTLKDRDLNDPDDFSDYWDYLDELTKNPGALRGYSTGWPTIDMATMGLQPGQLVTFVGPPKAGKSTILLSAADHINRQGVPVLLVSFEMSFDEQRARQVGLRAGTNFRRLLKGKKNDLDDKRLQKVYKELSKGMAPFILSEDISSTTTVGGIVAKVQQHKPKLVVVDGVYLMDDENGEPKGSPQAITNITRSLKRMALVMQVPVVISTQTLLNKMRGQQVKAQSIGYSSSFGQDSDTVIAVEPRDNPVTGETEHYLKVLLSRSGPLTEVQIDFDWAISSFSEYARSDDDAEAMDDPDEYDDGDVRAG